MNREQYLETAVDELTDYISKANYTVPSIKVSTGWPSSKAFSSKSRALGECWHHETLKQDASHIFISPYLSDSVEVLATLIHEIGHAILPAEAKHKAPFKRYMTAVDLVGKPTATSPGDILKSFLDLLINRIGTYPHDSIDKVAKDKKQTTRLRLWVCAGCDTKLRVAKDDLAVQCIPCDLQYVKQEKGDAE